jgi:hypothetical protein
MVAGESCSPHGSQEQSEREGAGDKVYLSRHTSVTYFLQPGLHSIIVSNYEPINELIHSLGQSPHSPITSQWFDTVSEDPKAFNTWAFRELFISKLQHLVLYLFPIRGFFSLLHNVCPSDMSLFPPVCMYGTCYSHLVRSVSLLLGAMDALSSPVPPNSLRVGLWHRDVNFAWTARSPLTFC